MKIYFLFSRLVITIKYNKQNFYIYLFLFNNHSTHKKGQTETERKKRKENITIH